MPELMKLWQWTEGTFFPPSNRAWTDILSLVEQGNISSEQLSTIIKFHLAGPGFETNLPAAGRRSQLFDNRSFRTLATIGGAVQEIVVLRKGSRDRQIFIKGDAATNPDNNAGRVIVPYSIKAGDGFLWIINEVLLPEPIAELCSERGERCVCGSSCCSGECLGSCQSSGFYLPFFLRRCS